MDRAEEEQMMRMALVQAKRAAAHAEIPVGAVLVHQGQVIARAYNRTIRDHNPTAHAEILTLQRGAHKLHSHYLNECDLYVTLEPCAMCAAAISIAKIRRLIIGTDSAKTGAVLHGIRFFEQSSCFHKPLVIQGILQSECAALLTAFFQQLRANKRVEG